jgi:hypothetical protein
LSTVSGWPRLTRRMDGLLIITVLLYLIEYNEWTDFLWKFDFFIFCSVVSVLITLTVKLVELDKGWLMIQLSKAGS